MSIHHNRVGFRATAGGTADFTVNTAMQGYGTPAQRNIANGSICIYTATLPTDQSQWELGRGTYNAGVVSRTTVRDSSDAGNKIDFTAAPDVWFDFHAQDIVGDEFDKVPYDGYTPILQLFDDSSTWGLSQANYGNDTGSGGAVFSKTRGTSPTTHAALANSDLIFSIDGYGSDGDSYLAAAAIAVRADAAFANNSTPGRIEIRTTPNGQSATREIVRFDSAGHFIIGGVAADQPYSFLEIVSGTGTSLGAESPHMTFSAHSAGGDCGILEFFLSKSDTIATKTPPSVNDTLGMLFYRGATTTASATGAVEFVRADADWSDTSAPSRFMWFTVPIGSITALERLRIDNAGRIIVGGVASDQGALLELVSGTGTTQGGGSFGLSLSAHSAANNCGEIDFYYSQSDTIATKAAATVNAWLGAVKWRGTDGTSNYSVAYELVHADADWTTGSMPTRFAWRTTPAGSTTPVENMRLTAAGLLYVGGQNSLPYPARLNSAANVGTDNDCVFAGISYGNWGYNGGIQLNKTRGANPTTHATLVTEDGVGAIYFNGSDGAAYRGVVKFEARAEGTIGAGYVPGRFVINTANAAGTMKEALRVDSLQAMIIGGVACTPIDYTHSQLQVNRSGAEAWHFQQTWHGYNGAAPSLAMTRTAATTASGHVAVASTDRLGELYAYGDDGSNAIIAAAIRFFVDGTVATSQVPGSIRFNTAPPTGGGSPERMRLDSSGRLVIGGVASQPTAWNVGAALQVHGLGGFATINLSNWDTGAGSSATIYIGKSKSGTIGTHTAVANGDSLGAYSFAASDGTNFHAVAGISANCDGAVSNDVIPSRMQFSTVDASGGSLTCMKMDSGGHVRIYGSHATKGAVELTSGGTYTVLPDDSSIICNTGEAVVMTLPSASSYPGRWLYFKTIGAFTITSEASNDCPATSMTPGTAITTGVAGRYAILQSNGQYWVKMQGGTAA